MLDGFGRAIDLMFKSEKARLVREADDAFYANDKATCIEAIEQLYDLFDDDTK